MYSSSLIKTFSEIGRWIHASESDYTSIRFKIQENNAKNLKQKLNSTLFLYVKRVSKGKTT